MALVVKNAPANSVGVRDASFSPGLGRSSGEGNGKTLQYSCLENLMDSWRATVHSIAQSHTWLKWFSMKLHSRKHLRLFPTTAFILNFPPQWLTFWLNIKFGLECIGNSILHDMYLLNTLFLFFRLHLRDPAVKWEVHLALQHKSECTSPSLRKIVTRHLFVKPVGANLNDNLILHFTGQLAFIWAINKPSFLLC